MRAASVTAQAVASCVLPAHFTDTIRKCKSASHPAWTLKAQLLDHTHERTLPDLVPALELLVGQGLHAFPREVHAYTVSVGQASDDPDTPALGNV